MCRNYTCNLHFFVLKFYCEINHEYEFYQKEIQKSGEHNVFQI